MPVAPNVVLKLDWAERHLRRGFHRRVDRFAASNYYRFRTELTADNWHVIFVDFLLPIPPVLGLIVGDFVHNARSALDQLAFALVGAAGGIPGRHTAFPIYSSQSDWRTNISARDSKRRGKPPTDGMSATAVDLLEKLQPYHSGDLAALTSLTRLQRLWNADKHRTINAVIAYLAFSGTTSIEIEPEGVALLLNPSITPPGTRLVHGTEVARTQILVREDAQNPAVVTRLQLPLGLMFGEPGHEDIALGSFQTMLREVRQIVDLFAPEFE